MRVAIPKEILPHEGRVAATPATVEKLQRLGCEVAVEAGAGLGAGIDDADYRQAGAVLVAQARELLQSADVVLKVKQPHFHEALGCHEVDLLRPGSTLITFLHPANPSNHEMVRNLARRNITSFTMDGIPRITRAQRMDALTSMSTITGYKSVLIAANELGVFVPIMTTAIGNLEPAKVLVIGGGVVGLQAIATAKRLGGVVSAADIRPDAREQAKSLGAKIIGFDVPVEAAVGEGGYARALPAALLEEERKLLAPAVAASSMVILSALVPGKVAPLLITDEMVASMKRGSVIVDVAIDQGGNCAATVAGEMAVRHGVTICGVVNIPGSLPVHATRLYSENIFNYVQNLFRNGLEQPDFDDEITRSTLVTHQGQILHAGTREAMGLA